MINHLRIHIYVWEKFIEQRKYFKQKANDKMIAKIYKEKKNVYESEGSTWQYFEEDPANSNILTC